MYLEREKHEFIRAFKLFHTYTKNYIYSSCLGGDGHPLKVEVAQPAAGGKAGEAGVVPPLARAVVEAVVGEKLVPIMYMYAC